GGIPRWGMVCGWTRGEISTWPMFWGRALRNIFGSDKSRNRRKGRATELVKQWQVAPGLQLGSLVMLHSVACLVLFPSLLRNLRRRQRTARSSIGSLRLLALSAL